MKTQRGTNRKFLTRLGLATALNLHPRTIQKLEEEGAPVEVRGRGGRPSQYDLSKWRKFLEERRKKAGTDSESGDGKLNVFQERARKEKWQGLLAEQQYLVRQRELLSRAEVEKVWTAELTAIRSKLLSWSTTLADHLHRVDTLEGLPGLERAIDEAVRNVLEELSQSSTTTAPPTKRRRRKAAA